MTTNFPSTWTIDPQELEEWTPHKIIAWAVATFGPDLAMTSSFQQQSVVLLHIVSWVAPDLPILFLDTGYHFPETLAFKDQLVEQFGLKNVQVIRPALSQEAQVAQYGPNLWQTNPDLCCYINKVQPLQEAMRHYRAWITGIRRDQATSRANTPIVDVREDGLTKIAPLANWTEEDVERYARFHNLPRHPLYDLGYKSIGCAPCTQPVQEGEDPRAGRWAGHAKKECGLHTVFRIK